MMKTKLFLGLGAVTLAILFSACDGELSPKPTISFQNTNPIVLDAGEDSTTIIGTIVAEAGLDMVEVIKITGLSEEEIGSYTSFESGPITTTDDVNYGINLPVTDITEDITIKVEVTDKDDQYASLSIEIVAAALFEQSDITLNAQANGPISSGENESFLSTADAETYTLNEINGDAAALASVDIMFMRHTIHKAGEPDFSLRSPDESGISDYMDAVGLTYPASGLNSTKLMLVSESLDWDTMDAGDFNTATTGVESAGDRVDDLDDGDIVAFMTDSGKKGLIHVVQIVDPGEVSERYMKSNIVIDYKVEP